MVFDDGLQRRVTLTAPGIFLILGLLAQPAAASDHPVLKYTQTLADTRYHRLTAEHLNRDFHLIVRPPAVAPDSPDSPGASVRVPAIYLLDGGFLFPMLSGYFNYLRSEAVVPEACIIGISYGASNFDEGNFRSSDYTAPSPTAAHYGGAKKFQQFLKEQVIPLIESNYPVDPHQRILFGQSIGGQFVIYSAMTQPTLFSGHIASNPALHNNLAYFLKPHHSPGAYSKLVVLRGSEDEPRFREPATAWMDHWLSQTDQLPVILEARVLDGYGHFSIPPESFRQGLIWLQQ